MVRGPVGFFLFLGRKPVTIDIGMPLDMTVLAENLHIIGIIFAVDCVVPEALLIFAAILALILGSFLGSLLGHLR